MFTLMSKFTGLKQQHVAKNYDIQIVQTVNGAFKIDDKPNGSIRNVVDLLPLSVEDCFCNICLVTRECVALFAITL